MKFNLLFIFMTMTAAEKEQIISRYVKAYNAKDVATMMADMAPDIVFENYLNGLCNMRLEGLEAFRQQAEQALAVFTERRQTITGFNHSGDQTEIAISYKATLANDLPNGMNKGDVLELSGRSVFTFSGNRVLKLEDHA